MSSSTPTPGSGSAPRSRCRCWRSPRPPGTTWPRSATAPGPATSSRSGARSCRSRTWRRSASRWRTRSALRRWRCAPSASRRPRPATRSWTACPCVDELGQYAHGTWPGKAGSVDDLQKAWRDEDRALAAGDFGFCRYGGFAATKADATGFFRVEKRDGRWWFVDPDGHLFLSLGADVIQPEMTTPAAGRDAFFRERPPAAVLPARERGGDRGVSFFTWNLLRRFGEGWPSAWVDHTLRRMDAWGLNTVANWSSPTAVGGEEEALRHPARELDHRRELPGPAGRLFGRLREGGRRARPPAVRAAEGRSLAPRLLPRQRAALPAKGAPDRRAHPRRPEDRHPGRPREVARGGGHRGAAEGVRRRRLRPLRLDHERRGEASRPEPPEPRDAQRRAAHRRRGPRRARLRRLQRQHLRLRGAGRAGAADRPAHRQADPDRRVPLRHAGPGAGGEPRPGARPGGAGQGLPLLRRERLRDAGDGRDALVPVGGPAVRPGASTARTTTSASWT